MLGQISDDAITAADGQVQRRLTAGVRGFDIRAVLQQQRKGIDRRLF